MTDKIMLTEDNLETISGGSETQWNEALAYLQQYILRTDPGYFKNPESPRLIEFARWMHDNIPGYTGAAVSRDDNGENDYFFAGRRLMSHAEFMKFLKANYN